MNLKTPLFILIIILKETIHIKIIIEIIVIKTIIQIDKHKAKYIITACIPIIIIKNFLLFAKNIYSYIKKNFFTTQLQNFSSFC